MIKLAAFLIILIALPSVLYFGFLQLCVLLSLWVSPKGGKR